MLYSRPPVPHEEADGLALVHELSQSETRDRAWGIYCQALLAGNEFIYLR
jgi:hypothetical protein